MKLCIIAGEHSGDIHGSMLAKKIKEMAPDIELFGIGGMRMQEAGVEIIHDMTEFAVVGFSEVIRHLRKFRKIFKEILFHIKIRKPDAVILIDLPGFNLRLGPKIKELGIPVLFYISPQVWAWGKSRIKSMRRFINKLFVIFPFEEEFFKKEGIDVEFVGHPIVDIVKTRYSRQEYRKIMGIRDNEKLIALLPGSREQEVVRILPILLKTAYKIREKLFDTRFIIPAASSYLYDLIHDIISGKNFHIGICIGDVYDVLNSSDAAIVSSGTATLEAAWLGTPFVIVYKMSSLSYFIARCLAKVKSAGIVNILAGREIVREYIQGDAKPSKIAEEIIKYITDENVAREKKEEYLKIRGLLGTGNAAQRVAEEVVKFLSGSHK